MLAAAVFSDDAFARGRNAVRFTDRHVQFVVDGRRWPLGRGALVLRCEAVASRLPYSLAALVAVLLGIVFLVLVGLARYIETPVSGRPEVRRRLAEAAVFVAIAAAVFATLYPGAPIRVEDWTDEANINSFAAAIDHPDRFALDKLLSDPAHYAWYTPAYVNTIRAFSHLGYHYETANAFLAAATALLLLFGLRRLFLEISGNAMFAIAGALALGLMADPASPAGEYWSILEVLPRMAFTAFVPWVLLLALWCAPSVRRWWIACGIAGLLMHVHPLSAPALEGALVIGFIAGSDESWARRIAGAAAASAAALATMGPYVVIYSARYGVSLDADPVITARAVELSRALFSDLAPGPVLRSILLHRLTSLRVLLDVLAVVLLLRHRFDRSLRFFLGCLAGFAIVTFAVPIVDGTIAIYLARRPYEYEMIRNVRYLDLMLAAAFALAVRDWHGSERWRRTVIAAGVVCAVLALGPGWYETARALAARGRASWRMVDGRPDAETRAAQEAIRAVQALRASSERVSGPVGLRQFFVPTAFTGKDIYGMSYSTSRGFIEATETVQRADALFARPITDESLGRLASVLDAQLFLLQRDQLDSTLAASPRVLFENKVFAIVGAGTR